MLNKKHESSHTWGDHRLHGGTAAGGIGRWWVCNQGVFCHSVKYALVDMHLKHRREREEQSSVSSKKEEHTKIQEWEAEDTLNNFHYETSTYYMILKNRSMAVVHQIFEVHCRASGVGTHVPTLNNIQAFLEAAETGHF